ncbi:MAG: hypothetical protein J7L14_01790 [Candidatus Diapherotrites archaeon]|nr:hypothetical protein [Candidatus Diapherotrites archaeon]
MFSPIEISELRFGKLAIDKSASITIVSHAHADHSNFSKHSEIISSKETLELLKVNKSIANNCRVLSFGKKEKLNELEFSLHNAGHILGSAQVLIDSLDIAVTNDFKLQDSLVTNAPEILQAKNLIIETTFALPSYVFPKREIIYEEMSRWCRKKLKEDNFIVLVGYALGKAQELTAFCNEYLNIAPLVHEAIFKNNEVYKKFGIKIGEYLLLNHNFNESQILILPPTIATPHIMQALKFSVNKKLTSAIASGWPYRRHYDINFPLSDHADFNQLVEYVLNSNARNVYTMHGFAKEFASILRRRYNINARPINETQRAIVDYLE